MSDGTQQSSATGKKRAHNRKLTDDQVRAIKAAVGRGEHNKAEIGRRFGVSSHTIRAIATGFNYGDVT